jgi:hypothetical protein
MRSAVVLHAARPGAAPDAADDGGAAAPLDAAALDAAALDAAALDAADEGEAGALGPAVVTVSVTVAVGAAGWPGAAVPQAATSDDATAAPASHASRDARPGVLAAIACLAPRAQPVVVASEAGAGERVDVDMTGPFVRRCG